MLKKIQTKTGRFITVFETAVTKEMKASSLDFAKAIILSDNQYLRLNPIEGNIDLQKKVQIQRTYTGKLGELVFSAFLTERGIKHSTDGMFDIYQGQTNVDEFDFKTPHNKTIDVKTGFRKIHTRLLINIEQFTNIPKDYYVGVKLNANDVDSSHKLVDLDSITSATIFGYAEYTYLKQRVKPANFGEGLAYAVPYENLLNIERIVSLFS